MLCCNVKYRVLYVKEEVVWLDYDFESDQQCDCYGMIFLYLVSFGEVGGGDFIIIIGKMIFRIWE